MTYCALALSLTYLSGILLNLMQIRIGYITRPTSLNSPQLLGNHQVGRQVHFNSCPHPGTAKHIHPPWPHLTQCW